MNIVYCTNESFAVHTAAGISSLLKSNAGERTDVFVLGDRLSPETVSRLEGLNDIEAVNKSGDLEAGRSGAVPSEPVLPETARSGTGRSEARVRVMDISGFDEAVRHYFKDKDSLGGFNITVLARIFADLYLPGEVDRYLYLDADTVVLSSIGGLYDIDLSGCVCAMAPEPTIYADVRKSLGMGEDEAYFNSGVMLTDRALWNKKEVTKRCVEYLESICDLHSGARLSFPDQDILNYVLKGEIKALSPKYNFFSNYYYRSYRSLCRTAGWYSRFVSEEDYREASDSPVIVHFAGAERPWYKGNRNPYRAGYEKALSMTPWRAAPEEEGHERFMLLYHMVNLLSKYVPFSRDFVSWVYRKSSERKSG